MNTPNTIKKKTQKNWETKLIWLDTLIPQHFKPLEADKSRFECIVCTKEKNPFNTGKSENILTHLDSTKHTQSLRNDSLNKQLIEAVRKIKYGDDYEEVTTLDQQGKEGSAELLQFEMAKFLVDNNLSFSLVEDLIPFLQSVSSRFNENAIRRSNMSRKTVTKLITHCICGSLKQQIINDLVVSPFSMAIDETTDPYGSSYLAICVKYHDHKARQILTKFVSIVSLDESKTGEAIYGKLKEEIFSQDERLLKNLVSLVTDQGSSMVGKEKGVGALLSKDCPQIVRLNDTSHMYHLIAQHSMKVYPSSIMSIIRSICSHFNTSSIRAAKLNRIQRELGVKEPLEILSFAPTRWLSLTDCLRRIIRLWEPLKKYYEEEGDEDEKKYFLPKNELFLRTILVLLEKLCHYNVRFQTQDLFYNTVAREMELSFKEFAIIVLSKGAWDGMDFEDKLNIQFNLPKEELAAFLKDEDSFLAYWGTSFDFLDLMDQLSSEDVSEVLEFNKDFILKVLSEMQRRLPFRDSFLERYKAIFLTKAVDRNDWKYLFERYRNIIPPELDGDWRLELDRFVLHDDLLNEAKTFRGNYLEMWNHFGDFYPLLSALAMALLTIAHSSVPVERVFSWLKDIKSPKRNRLDIENLEACLLTSQKNTELGSWTITEDMLQRRSSMWKEQSISESGVKKVLQIEGNLVEEELSEMIQELSIDMKLNDQKMTNICSEKPHFGTNILEEEKVNQGVAQESKQEAEEIEEEQEMSIRRTVNNPKKRKAADNGAREQMKPGVKISDQTKEGKGLTKEAKKNL